MAEPRVANPMFVERVVDGLVEMFWTLQDVWAAEFIQKGRPIFSVNLTPEQQLLYFMDDTLRSQRLQQIADHEGLAAAVAWRDKMESLMRKHMAAGTGPMAPQPAPASPEVNSG